MSEPSRSVGCMGLLDRAEQRRTTSLASLDKAKQAQQGQYFTPRLAARIIAAMPRVPERGDLRVLDPGAGSGILSAALIERIAHECPDLNVHVTAVENDPHLHAALRETLGDLESAGRVQTELVDEDFLRWALATEQRFDVIVQNPPYHKLSSSSAEQDLLRRNGVVVPNIYAAFLALGLRLLDEGSQQVAITPRSWMNGTYYAPFRREFANRVAVDAIHTFESRRKVFADTGVLQESIIVAATRNGVKGSVSIATSVDHSTEPRRRVVDYTDIVTPDFIHVPATDRDAQAVSWMTRAANSTLDDLGLSVSTGRVVDFRSRGLIYREPPVGAVPMVHATHVRPGRAVHPLVQVKKPEWFHDSTGANEKLLVPGGAYVLIKRFSAKEERRRVVAAVWTSDNPAAFDNKLNFIHLGGKGLDPELAYGLMIFLNSTQLDDYFRVFSGHTQVNATDLRQMRFPTSEQLRRLAATDPSSQANIDEAVNSVLGAEEAAV